MNAWRAWRDPAVLTRLAMPTDRASVSALLAGTWRRHGNQSLEDQAALLANGHSAVAFAGGSAVGFLGIDLRSPSEPSSISGGEIRAERWADVQLVALETGRRGEDVLAPLLLASRPALQQAACTGVVALVPPGWLSDGLSKAGFHNRDEVLTYVLNGRQAPQPAEGPARLWPAGGRDAETILRLNALAFEPLWRYDDAVIMGWLLSADRAVIAEVDGEPAGFALTTDGPSGSYAHLIRVATHPRFRGRNVGRQLVVDAILHAHSVGAPGLALNTQASNSISRNLYESLGFRSTGHVLIVQVAPIDG